MGMIGFGLIGSCSPLVELFLVLGLIRIENAMASGHPDHC
jgi:hypothetical protein